VTTLHTALTRYPHTAALVDGEVRPQSVELEFAALTSIFPAFRAMARRREYDMSEFGISTAIQAKALGVGFTPLPVFVTRRYDYEAIFTYEGSGVEEPKDLEGNKVGLRSYTVTDALWSRGMLADRFGLDTDAVTWVVTADEHLEQAVLPPNAVLQPGADLVELLRSGEIVAMLGGHDGSDPRVRPLVPDTAALERRWIEEHHFVPVHHTVVVRDELLAADPDLATDLYRAFVGAKAPFLARLAAGEDIVGGDASPTGPLHDYGVTATENLVRPDPVPYGLAANRGVLEAMARYCYDQRLIDAPMELEAIFAAVEE